MHGHLNVKYEVIFWFHLIITERGLHLILHCHEHEMYSVLLYVVLLWKGSYDMSDPNYHIWTRGMPIFHPLSTCAVPKLWLCLYLMLSWINGSYMVSCGIYLTKDSILFIKVQWNPVVTIWIEEGLSWMKSSIINTLFSYGSVVEFKAATTSAAVWKFYQ